MKTTKAVIAARLSIIAVITYQVILIALIFIRPDLDPYWHTISEWAIGPYGWIMSLAFLFSALSYGSLFVAIKSQIYGILGKIGLSLLLICTVCTVGVGVFTTDPLDIDPAKLTTTGALHMISGFAGLMLLPFAAFLINLSLFLKNKERAPFRWIILCTGCLPIIGLIGFWLHLSIYVIPLGDHAYGPNVPLGYPSRLLFLIYLIWLITLAWKTIKISERTEST